MSSEAQFTCALIGVLLAWGAWSLRGVNLREFFATRTGKGIAKGVVLAVVFAVGLVLLTGCTDVSVFAGLDYTKNDSPQCENGGPDNHTTSNLGLRGTAYASDDGRFRVGGKYTHHSCAFSPDAASYDAAGVEFEYKLWAR
jgi:hypothetical protein